MCFDRAVEVVTVLVTERPFLTSAFRVAEGCVVVDEEEEDGADCGGRGSEAEAVLGRTLGGALLRCEVSGFPVDPPPFCDFCLTTFKRSICVSAVP